MIEIAAILSAVVRHWEDLVVILVLLVFNAVVGFVQEYQASNAVEALKQQLALKARVLRDAKWREIDAADLIPGDVVRVRLGDVIPADVKLLEGEYLSVDQAALTGESLPVTKRPGEVAYSGSIAKQGEMVALVVATGQDTFFGRTAKLVQSARSVSHFQKAVLQIGDYLIYLALALVGVLIVVQLLRGASFVSLIQFALILTVAAIPVAMPAVLSVTMAVGSVALSKMKAIVSRLESIEEMAGMDVLCSDKTGTLTKNELTLGDPVSFRDATKEELLRVAALACKAENQDPIDLAVLAGAGAQGTRDGYVQRSFTPFDPVRKRTDAEIQGPDGQTFTAIKGAPQVVLDLADLNPQLRQRVQESVDEFAAKGYRTLGVARTENGHTRFLGLVPLFDPPREDSARTIAQAREYGITVKMVTGDDVAIARETAAQLGLGTNIVVADHTLTDADGDGEAVHPSELGELAERADGFARVFPEHKFQIVKALQGRGHIVGMTGDGVNDAPALKQADVGTAVLGRHRRRPRRRRPGADRARAVGDRQRGRAGPDDLRADEQLRDLPDHRDDPGDGVRRRGDDRVQLLSDHRDPDHPARAVQRRADHDHRLRQHPADPQPVRWDMRRVLSVSTVLGTVGVIETFGLLVIAKNWLQP